MAKETAAVDYSAASKFVSTNGSVDEGGATRSLTRGQYYDFFKQNGIDRAVMDQVTAVTDQLIGGSIEAATNDLEKRIKDAKEAGDEPVGFQQDVRVATPTGRIDVTVFAQRTSKNPLTGEQLIKHGGVRVATKFSKTSVPKGPAEDARQTIAKAMGH